MTVREGRSCGGKSTNCTTKSQHKIINKNMFSKMGTVLPHITQMMVGLVLRARSLDSHSVVQQRLYPGQHFWSALVFQGSNDIKCSDTGTVHI